MSSFISFDSLQVRADNRDARIGSWVHALDSSSNRNCWKSGAAIGALVGTLFGGEMTLHRLRERHIGAGGPEYLLINGLFPGFVIGGAVGAITGYQIQTCR